MTKSLNIGFLFACIALILILGVLPGFFTMGEIKTWHSQLNKPSINPPNYLFGPVWTILYTLMGVTLYRILRTEKDQWRKKSLILFSTQMSLNLLWTIIFFKLHLMQVAFVEIVGLWLAILLMIIQLYKRDKLSAWLNVPYLLWVGFASILNFAFILNN